ncbi:hypothetical protein ANTQUA_LOCUS2762 [Anthophora quadrimaculata]
MQLSTVILESVNQPINYSKGTKSVPIVQNQLNKVLLISIVNETVNSKFNMAIPTTNGVHAYTLKTESDIKSTMKIPVLKITINKRYNKPCAPNINQNTQISTVNNIDVTCKTEKSNFIKETNSHLKNDAQNISHSTKPIVSNVVPAVFEKSITYKNEVTKTKDMYVPKNAYTRKGDLSRDHSRTQTSTERIRYLYTKAQRDCNVLRMRLKALRERYLREKEEIKKLQVHLGNCYKNIAKEHVTETSEDCLKKEKLFTSSDDTEEEGKEEEYKRLLRKVKKIKYDISDNEILISEENCFEKIFMDT